MCPDFGATGSAGAACDADRKAPGSAASDCAGRNVEACLKKLGADAVISMSQERALIATYRKEWAESGVDVVLDYLWGKPAENAAGGHRAKGLQQRASRIRYVQIGSIAGEAITLPGATLRSSKLEILGSGFGSASMQEMLQGTAEFLAESAREPFQANIEPAPLRDVEALWVRPEKGTRLVFQP